MEINTIIVNKRTFNNGIIFFDNPKKMNAWLEILQLNRVNYVTYVVSNEGKNYYGVRMFRMKKQFFKLCVELKEVFFNEN